MSWWLLITSIIAAALAYGYWDHVHERRHLARIFARLAQERRGEVKPGSWLVFSQLRFEMENRHYLVAAMATDGSDSGESGPFTVVDVQLPFDTRRMERMIRVKRRAREATRFIGNSADSIAPGTRPTTPLKQFDEAFHVEGGDQSFAYYLLQAGVREKLLGSCLPRLDVRVKDAKISVTMDGIAKTKADLDELIDIASLLASQCPANF